VAVSMEHVTGFALSFLRSTRQINRASRCRAREFLTAERQDPDQPADANERGHGAEHEGAANAAHPTPKRPLASPATLVAAPCPPGLPHKLSPRIGYSTRANATFAPNSTAMAVVDTRRQDVKFVPIDPMSPVRILTLSASEIDPDQATCHTKAEIGSHVAKTNTASPLVAASRMYLPWTKTCLRPAAIIDGSLLLESGCR